MPFIPHTKEDVQAMLETIGVNSIQDLFAEIPTSLQNEQLDGVPKGISEMQLLRLMEEYSTQDNPLLCFAGAGAYQHHIPSAVWDITARGEFMTAYTPYQAEASQGTLQLIYEYQTMMANLTDMDVSNASVYDGASGLAEAVLMAIRANRRVKSRKILFAETIHPSYRQATVNIAKHQDIQFDTLSFSDENGVTALSSLPSSAKNEFSALVIQSPNFFGNLEYVDELTNWGHENGALVIAVVNPTSLAMLKPPGQWGDKGVDIVVGDNQPLGIPLSGGGPYCGFICCRKEWTRQIPGRLIGRTDDANGNDGFTLTLQGREQHIRRSKATSNICTNQGLLVTAATIYMSLLGGQGLKQVAQSCHHNTAQLAQAVSSIPGVSLAFEHPFFHEVVIRLPKPPSQVMESMANQGILAGVYLGCSYHQLRDCILVCATETKTEQDIERYVAALKAALC